MSGWSRRKQETFPEFNLSQLKQYLEYCQNGAEHEERERYVRLTTSAFHLNKQVDNLAVLNGVPEYQDSRVKDFEKRLQAGNRLTFHSIISEPLGYFCFCQHICESQGVSPNEFWMEVMSFEMWTVHRHARWIQRKNPMKKKCQGEMPEELKSGSNKNGRIGNLMGLEESDSADSQYNEQLEEKKIRRNVSRWELTVPEDKEMNRQASVVLFGAVNEDDPSGVGTKESKEELTFKTMKGAKRIPLVDFLISRGYHETGGQSLAQKTTCTDEKSSTCLHHSESQFVSSDAGEGRPKDTVYRRLTEEEIHNFKNSLHYKMYICYLYKEQVFVKPDDFTIIKLLGQGGFGKVFCCRKIDSGKLYAVKCLSKMRIIQKKAISMTKLEKDSMARLRSNFVVGLDFACQDNDNLYIVMTLMTGGNLRYHLRRDGFGEHLTRFFAGQVLLGLEHMHKLRILYRDLKLDNILLDHRGNCRLSDLGLCGILPVGKQKTRYAGTPGYMAPEVIMRRPYDMSADIWSYGVCIYRMISGCKPFDGPNRHSLNQSVLAACPAYGSIFSEDAKKLIKGLLNKSPVSRLGMVEIKNSEFFKSLDWNLLSAGMIKPPYVPSSESLHAPTTKELMNAPVDKKKNKLDKKALRRLEERYKNTFDDWDYISPHAVQTEIVEALKLKQQTIPDEIQSTPNSCCRIA